MSVFDKLADAIAADTIVSDIEHLCRVHVAGEIKRERRLLAEDEVEDIVEDVVDGESFVELEDAVSDDGFIDMTDAEWENVPADDKVVLEKDDGNDVEGAVVGGRFLPVRLHEDPRPASIARRINASIKEAAHIANSVDGVNVKSLYHPVPDVCMPCPACASRDVTPVWFDSGEVVACCNRCGAEFDASTDEVARATLAERTVEDIDILPEFDVFGSVWCQDDGRFGYEVYASGELVDSGAADTFEGVQERFDDIADGFDDIEDGSSIVFENGPEDVEDVDGDRVVFEGGRAASRIRLARMLADHVAYLDNSGVTRMKLSPGMEFSSQMGTVVVASVDGDEVYANLIRCASDGRVVEDYVRYTRPQFKRMLRDGGWC